jgi:hypothetical protein
VQGGYYDASAVICKRQSKVRLASIKQTTEFFTLAGMPQAAAFF